MEWLGNTLAKWLLEFLGIPRIFLGIKVWIFTVNSDWEFLGIPNHNNSGSKNLEIPRNSQKFQVYSQQDLEFQLKEPMTFPEKL